MAEHKHHLVFAGFRKVDDKRVELWRCAASEEIRGGATSR